MTDLPKGESLTPEDRALIERLFGQAVPEWMDDVVPSALARLLAAAREEGRTSAPPEGGKRALREAEPGWLQRSFDQAKRHLGSPSPAALPEGARERLEGFADLVTSIPDGAPQIVEFGLSNIKRLAEDLRALLAHPQGGENRVEGRPELPSADAGPYPRSPETLAERLIALFPDFDPGASDAEKLVWFDRFASAFAPIFSDGEGRAPSSTTERQQEPRDEQSLSTAQAEIALLTEALEACQRAEREWSDDNLRQRAEIARLRGALTEASDAMRMTALAMEAPLGRITKKNVLHWTSLFHKASEGARAGALRQTGRGRVSEEQFYALELWVTATALAAARSPDADSAYIAQLRRDEAKRLLVAINPDPTHD